MVKSWLQPSGQASGTTTYWTTFLFWFSHFPRLVCSCKSSLAWWHPHGWQCSFPPSFFCLLFKCNKFLLKILYTTVVILIAHENHIWNTNSSGLLHSTYLGVCGSQPLCKYLNVICCMAQGSANISTPSSKYTPILAYYYWHQNLRFRTQRHPWSPTKLIPTSQWGPDWCLS